MHPPRIVPLLIYACLAFPASRLEAAYIDSINADAVPASNEINTIFYSSSENGQGWYYTPAFSYTLTGIFTNFGQSNSTFVTPEITVQIQTDRPVNGGTVLAQGMFQGNSADGGIGGTSVEPISLVGGQTYFVDFLNDVGMGINLGFWQDVGSVPTPSDGATVNLGTYYYDPLPSTGFSQSIGDGANETFFGTVQASGGEPILLFNGFIPGTPEPSSILLMAIGGAAIAFANRRRFTSVNRQAA
jgi:hypothetical protein